MFPLKLAIKLTSRGPVFFKQERLGQNERFFTFIKFRTMINDAEKATGPKWASEDDPRITKVGKILRKTRLDELPQPDLPAGHRYVGIMQGLKKDKRRSWNTTSITFRTNPFYLTSL